MIGPLRLSPRVLVAAALSTLAAAFVGWMTLAQGSSPAVDSTTPIKHVVVIFDENESFDHYFGTYPNAENRAGERTFTAKGGTPAIDGLTPALLTANPNRYNPQRLPASSALTCDANHAYSPEQAAYNNGLMDKFVENTGGACSVPGGNLVMDYFDGNTVTGLWNLAQNFSMSDNYFGSSFGPSTPGALNLISGSTHGASPAVGNSIVDGTMIADPDPALDDCGNGSATMSGRNVGDLMNARGVTWGWFQGGFRPTSNAGGRAVCGSAHRNIGGATIADYSAHHEPFMYYASTANQHHLPPTSVANIGHSDQANHQYDLADFDDAVRADNLPQVSFLKAAAFEDGHPGYSDPLDEQAWIARAVNEVEQSPDWASTAIVVTYDDSDGWYDHANAVTQGSNLSDGSDKTVCTGAAGAGNPDYAGRCGPGPRLPLLVVSPYAKVNDVESGTRLEQASVTRFIQDNWNLGSLSTVNNPSFADTRAASMNDLFDFAGPTRAPKVYLDPATGQVLCAPPSGLTASPNTTTTTLPTCSTPPPPPTTTTTTITTPRPPTTTPARPITPSRPSTKLTIRPASYKYKRSGKKLTLTFTYRGVTASKGRLTVSAKATLKRKTIATAATKTIRSGRASLTLRARKAIKKGKYTFTLRFRQGRLTATVTKTITIR